jgi:pyrroline-5-carboxylate reductase
MNSKNIKIGIIGAGNIGGAIAGGLSRGKIVKAENIFVSDVNSENLQSLKIFDDKINVFSSNVEVVKNADCVIIAVKPWLVETVAHEISPCFDSQNQILVSVAASVNLGRLQELFGFETPVFRVIPNIAIEIMQSVNSIASVNTTAEQKELVMAVFGELGKTFYVNEPQLDALMALTSCGIAYAFRYIRAATEGGVEIGLTPAVAKEAVVQTLRGAIELLSAKGAHPEAEIDKITTAGGITLTGLNEMEACGFTNAVIKGIKASKII